MQLIHGVNIYEGFPYDKIPYKMHTWPQVYNPIFEAIISQIEPRVIIEIGTWLGGSALTMAEICKELDLDTTIICVDTWLGGYGEIKEGKYKELMYMKNGYPGLYWQFLANVLHRGLDNMIVPIANTSSIGARIIKDCGLKADIIFVDGSHLEEDVYRDMKDYYPLLRDENSQMFGDDLHSEPIERAVKRFCKDSNMSYCNIGNHFWTLEKSDDSDSDSSKE